MKEPTRLRMLVVTFCFTVLGLPAIASAGLQDNIGERTAVRVSYADLDLASEVGMTVLYRRLQNAAKKVCGPLNYRQAGSLTLLRLNRQCYENALDKAVRKINVAGLEEIHRG